MHIDRNYNWKQVPIKTTSMVSNRQSHGHMKLWRSTCIIPQWCSFKMRGRLSIGRESNIKLSVGWKRFASSVVRNYDMHGQSSNWSIEVFESKKDEWIKHVSTWKDFKLFSNSFLSKCFKVGEYEKLSVTAPSVSVDEFQGTAFLYGAIKVEFKMVSNANSLKPVWMVAVSGKPARVKSEKKTQTRTSSAWRKITTYCEKHKIYNVTVEQNKGKCRNDLQDWPTVLRYHGSDRPKYDWLNRDTEGQANRNVTSK